MGPCGKALVALVAPRARTVARGIRAAMRGWLTSTNQGSLIALLTHRDADMPKLRREFEKEFDNKTLQSVIKKECNGMFETALVGLTR